MKSPKLKEINLDMLSRLSSITFAEELPLVRVLDVSSLKALSRATIRAMIEKVPNLECLNVSTSEATLPLVCQIVQVLPSLRILLADSIGWSQDGDEEEEEGQKKQDRMEVDQKEDRHVIRSASLFH